LGAQETRDQIIKKKDSGMTQVAIVVYCGATHKDFEVFLDN
jgi:hypothetical protein